MIQDVVQDENRGEVNKFIRSNKEVAVASYPELPARPPEDWPNLPARIPVLLPLAQLAVVPACSAVRNDAL